MAFLVDENSHTRCYLYAHHSFGRLAYSVNTVIAKPEISKIHAIIVYEKKHWYLRDLSKNGTWLNNSRLIENTNYPLSIGDKISFSRADQNVYSIKNLDAPSDMLIPCDNQHGLDIPSAMEKDAILLHQYHLLPTEEEAELAIFFDHMGGQWCVENISVADPQQRLLNEHDTIEFGNHQWRLQLSHLEKPTKLLSQSQQQVEELVFVFSLSPDEEITRLILQQAENIIDFDIRTHHYLTLNLARYRFRDAEKGFAEESQGWIYTEQLEKDLGINSSHLNIQIHRARKQLADELGNTYDTDYFIQRQAGKVRLGHPLFKIYKGKKLECALNIPANELDR